MKFRIKKNLNGKYIIQKKFLFFWLNCINCAEYDVEFDDIESAEKYINDYVDRSRNMKEIIKELHF